MTTCIQGISWLTPLGNSLDGVWSRLMAGETGPVKEISRGQGGRTHFHMPVPLETLAALGKNPRLRRSSAISYFTAAAGLAALEDAGIKSPAENPARVAVIAAVSSGGVVYTRRFYEIIVEKGASAASPLLFPETVYNAPASHLAALLGINGVTYTLVGDSSVGIAALNLGAQLLETGQADHCLVVGAEEVDWVLCEGYRTWRFVTDKPEIALFARPPVGTLLAEGAAAVVLGRDGPVRLRRIHPGVPFFNTSGAGKAASQVLSSLAEEPEISLITASANGSFVDGVETAALRTILPDVPVYCPKAALGDALGAASLVQTVAAVLALRKREIPPTLGLARSVEKPAVSPKPRTGVEIGSALVLAVGFNQQAAGLVLSA